MDKVKSLPVVPRNTDQDFLDQAFFIALPMALTQDTWTKGEDSKPIRLLGARVRLAWDIADEALVKRRIAPPPTKEPKG